MSVTVTVNAAWQRMMRSQTFDHAVAAGLDRCARAGALREFRENFAARGRPKWKPLSARYAKRKMKLGKPPLADLVVSGKLREHALRPRLLRKRRSVTLTVDPAAVPYAGYVNNPRFKHHRTFMGVPRSRQHVLADEFMVGFFNALEGRPGPASGLLG